MSLQIGVAVGDIEKIQHNAYLKRIGLQVFIIACSNWMCLIVVCNYTYICPALSVLPSFLPSFLPSVRPSGTLGGHARRARPKGAPEGRARPEGGRAQRAPSGAPLCGHWPQAAGVSFISSLGY